MLLGMYEDIFNRAHEHRRRSAGCTVVPITHTHTAPATHSEGTQAFATRNPAKQETQENQITFHEQLVFTSTSVGQRTDYTPLESVRQFDTKCRWNSHKVCT